MVEIADIRDEESFREWLEDKPPELAVLLAGRASSRAIPSIFADLYGGESPVGSTNMKAHLNIWRVVLATRTFAVWPWRSIAGAAVSAGEAVWANGLEVSSTSPVFHLYSSLFSTALAAEACSFDDGSGALDAAKAAVESSRPLWSEVRRDAEFYKTGNLEASFAYWDSGIPLEIAEAWDFARKVFATRIEAGETGWQFWLDWYEAQLSGAAQNWEMLKEIVLIPDDDWQQGAAHVNGLIEGIRLEYAIPASPNAEVLEVNPETGLIRSRPLSEIAARFLQDCHARIRDATEILGDPAEGNNPYGALAPEIATLERALDRYPDRPQRLHDIALQVVRRVAARERTGDIPEAEKDALVGDFKSELIGVANDIRQQDAEVQKVVDARVTDKLRNADPADAAVLPEAAPVLAEATERELGAELVEDADVAVDAEADPQTRKEALYRVASRSFRIVSLLYKVPRAVLKEGAEVSKDIATIVTNSAKVKIAIAILLALFG